MKEKIYKKTSKRVGKWENCRIEHGTFSDSIHFSIELNYSLQLESKRLSQSCRNVDIVNWKAPKSRQQQNWSQHYSISLIEVPGNWFFTSIVSLSSFHLADSSSLCYMMMSLVHFPSSSAHSAQQSHPSHDRHLERPRMRKRAIRKQKKSPSPPNVNDNIEGK